MTIYTIRQRNIRTVSACVFLIILTICLYFALLISHADFGDANDRIENGQTITIDASQAQELFNQLASEDLGEFFTFDETYFEKLNEIAVTMSMSVMGIAGLLFTVYMYWIILQELKKGEITLDIFLKFLIKFAVGALILMMTDKIFEALISFGKGLLVWLNTEGSITLNEGLFTNEVTMDSTTGTLSLHSIAFFQDAVDWLSVSLKAAINIMNYALLLEFAIRRSFAPLALASVIIEGTRSTGYRYILKTIGLFFKMAVVLLAYKISLIAAYTIPLNQLTAMFFMSAATVFIHKNVTLQDEVLGLKS